MGMAKLCFIILLSSISPIFADEPPISPVAVESLESNPKAVENLESNPKAVESSESNPKAVEKGSRLGKLGLSPFGLSVYQLAVPSGVFEHLFDSCFKPSDAENAFYNAALYFSEQLGDTHLGELPTKVAQAARDFFKKGATRLDYFKVFINIIEDYLKTKELLSPDSTESVAKSYHDDLDDLLKIVGTIERSKSALYVLISGTINFLKSTGEVSSESVTRILEKFIEETKNIHNVKPIE